MTDQRTITITSADGVVFAIRFHRTANRCWHLTLPNPQHEDFRPFPGDAIIRVSDTDYRIETTSLGRLMEFVGHLISDTEF
jgi:hypothetical protein